MNEPSEAPPRSSLACRADCGVRSDSSAPAPPQAPQPRRVVWAFPAATPLSHVTLARPRCLRTLPGAQHTAGQRQHSERGAHRGACPRPSAGGGPAPREARQARQLQRQSRATKEQAPGRGAEPRLILIPARCSSSVSRHHNPPPWTCATARHGLLRASLALPSQPSLHPAHSSPRNPATARRVTPPLPRGPSVGRKAPSPWLLGPGSQLPRPKSPSLPGYTRVTRTSRAPNRGLCLDHPLQHPGAVPSPPASLLCGGPLATCPTPGRCAESSSHHPPAALRLPGSNPKPCESSDWGLLRPLTRLQQLEPMPHTTRRVSR